MKSLKSVFLVITTFSLLVACQTTGPVAPKETEMMAVARELLSQVPSGTRIAIKPLRGEETTVPLEATNRVNDALENGIFKAYPAKFTIVARSEMKAVQEEQYEFGNISDMGKILEAARADVLIVPDMDAAISGVAVTYKAIMGAEIIGQSNRRIVKMALENSPAVSMDVAIKTIVDRLVSQRGDIHSVRKLGIYFENTDVQTEFATYLLSALDAQLVESLNGADIRTAQIADSQVVAITGDEGLEIERQIAVATGSYLLSGTYWDLDDVIELRVALEATGGRKLVERIKIDVDTIPSELDIHPDVDTDNSFDNLGPIHVKLSSNRGQRPVFYVGELAHLAMQISRDGYLYCFDDAGSVAGQDKRQIVKIFPNRWHPDARIQGNTPLLIPGDTMDFNLRVQPPAGVERIRCFVFDRDVENQLPADIRFNDLTPLKFGNLDQLSQVFRTLPGVDVSEATMTISVLER